MARRKPQLGAAARIVLHESLSHAQARDLADQLSAARGSDVEVDASAVQHLGAQCAQVLVAASQSWRSAGHALSITKASIPFVDGVRLLGLAGHLNA